jgi:hypothetical protein
MTGSASVGRLFRNVAPFDIFLKFGTHLKTHTAPENGTPRCSLNVCAPNEVAVLLYTLLAFERSFTCQVWLRMDDSTRSSLHDCERPGRVFHRPRRVMHASSYKHVTHVL